MLNIYFSTYITHMIIRAWNSQPKFLNSTQENVVHGTWTWCELTFLSPWLTVSSSTAYANSACDDNWTVLSLVDGQWFNNIDIKIC